MEDRGVRKPPNYPPENRSGTLLEGGGGVVCGRRHRRRLTIHSFANDWFVVLGDGCFFLAFRVPFEFGCAGVCECVCVRIVDSMCAPFSTHVRKIDAPVCFWPGFSNGFLPVYFVSCGLFGRDAWTFSFFFACLSVVVDFASEKRRKKFCERVRPSTRGYSSSPTQKYKKKSPKFKY